MISFSAMEIEASTSKRNYTRLDFNLEQEEKLIEYVKDHPALFDPRDSQYKSRTYRDHLWAEFASSINKTGKQMFSFFIILFCAKYQCISFRS